MDDTFYYVAKSYKKNIENSYLTIQPVEKYYLPVCTHTMLHKHNLFNHINGYYSTVANPLHFVIIQSCLHSTIINIHLNTPLTYIYVFPIIVNNLCQSLIQPMPNHSLLFCIIIFAHVLTRDCTFVSLILTTNIQWYGVRFELCITTSQYIHSRLVVCN